MKLFIVKLVWFGLVINFNAKQLLYSCWFESLKLVFLPLGTFGWNYQKLLFEMFYMNQKSDYEQWKLVFYIGIISLVILVINAFLSYMVLVFIADISIWKKYFPLYFYTFITSKVYYFFKYIILNFSRVKAFPVISLFIPILSIKRHMMARKSYPRALKTDIKWKFSKKIHPNMSNQNLMTIAFLFRVIFNERR